MSLNGFTSSVSDEVRKSKVLIELVTLKLYYKLVEKFVKFKRLNLVSNVWETTNKRSNIGNIATEKCISIGSKVTFRRLSDDKIYTYQILSYSDLTNNILSNENPLSLAMLNHKVGDVITVHAPKGNYEISILEIK